MKIGVLLLNFGEPERPSLEDVTSFLEAIFLTNFQLEHEGRPEAGRQRAAELASRRAPDLLEDYRKIGGSPIRRQSEAQARALDVELRRRGHDVVVTVGMQYAPPRVEEAFAHLARHRLDIVIGVPLYPLCGPSTTIPALDELRRIASRSAPGVDIREVAGWHAHPEYVRLRARGVRRFAEARGLDLGYDGLEIVFAAHGTPTKYLDDGSRYERYVHEHCAAIARELGIGPPVVGFQNHANRPDVKWTGPDVDEVVEGIEAGAVLVVPVSFMQELSETLVELDIDLRGAAEARGLEYFRAPVPHDDPKFLSVLADTVEGALEANGACRCRPGAYCLSS